MAKNKRGRRKAGEGTVYQRDDGLWVAEKSVGARGHRRRARGTGKTIDAAIAKRKLDERRLGFTPQVPERQTVADFLGWWLDVELAARVADRTDPFTQTTLDGYRSKVTLYLVPLVGHHRLSKLSAQQVRGMLRAMSTMHGTRFDRPLSPRTIEYALQILSSALTCAYQYDLVDQNVARRVPSPRVTRERPTPLPVAAAKAILAAVDDDAHCNYRALWVVPLSVGLRPGEALGLCWDAVDLDDRMLVVRRNLVRHSGRYWLHDTKAHRQRYVPLPGFAVAALRSHRRLQLEQRMRAGGSWQVEDIRTTAGVPLGDELVFRQPSGRSVRLDWMTDELKRVCRRAGVPVLTPHKFTRHGGATIMLAQGVDMATIREVLGHSNISVTEIYAQVVPESMRRAASAMDDALGER